jgi:hypothetical protein
MTLSKQTTTQAAALMRANFAAAIARDEFGRFYWNGKLARQLIEAMARRPGKKNRPNHPGKVARRDGHPY